MKENKKYTVSEYDNGYQDVETFDTLDEAKEFAENYAYHNKILPSDVSVWENIYDKDGCFIGGDCICTTANYFTADRLTGNVIDEFITLEEAKKALMEYYEEDLEEGNYEENFYDILDQNHNSVI